MESVGSQLRQARLSLGLTLEQACAKTRISIKNLQAIEDDNLAGFTSAFFYRSFVRQFAEYLNLDYNRLAPAVREVTSTIPEPLMPGQVPIVGGQIPEQKIAPLGVKPRPKNLRWLSSLTSFVIMLVACSSFYSIWQNSRSNWHASFTTFVKSLAPASHGGHVAATRPNLAQIAPAIPQLPAPATQSRSAGLSDGRPNSGPSSNSAPPQEGVKPAEPKNEFHVELSVVERTWLSIVSDGKEIFNGILEPAETKVLEGHEIARIRTGNAGALSLVFNGKPIGALGARGQVRTVIFTKDNYEVLEPSPHLTLTAFNPNGE
jgi:cytoskeletal protein RodZ